MIRFLIHIAISLVTAALALWLCSLILGDNFRLEWQGFFLAVAVFTIAQAVLAPFAFNIARKYASGLIGAIGLVATLLALWVTTLFPGGLAINGVVTWILAALIVWILTALGTWLLPMIFLKKKTSSS